MSLIDLGYACAPIATLFGGALFGWVLGRRRQDRQTWAHATQAEPRPVPTATVVLPKVPMTGTGWPDPSRQQQVLMPSGTRWVPRPSPRPRAWPPDQPMALGRGAEWVPRRRPSPHPRPPDMHLPNGYAPGRCPVRGEEGHDND